MNSEQGYWTLGVYLRSDDRGPLSSERKYTPKVQYPCSEFIQQDEAHQSEKRTLQRKAENYEVTMSPVYISGQPGLSHIRDFIRYRASFVRSEYFAGPTIAALGGRASTRTSR